MRIACLQFSPRVAEVNSNLSAADAILSKANPKDLDLLVLPELAFTGYNFKSLGQISPFLEVSNSGISSLWARNTALKHDCTVVVGYPEKVDPTLNWPTGPEYYNSAIVINGEGETVANYRKSHLYYTDETWALEGTHGFFSGRIPGLGRAAIGICMDLNPYKFEASWDQFEFAQHALSSGARLVIVSMAWLTHDDPQSFNGMAQDPDTNTLLYWVSRLEPIIRIESNVEVIVVFANRCGAEDEVNYVGTSAVIGIQSGEIKVYGILGRGETELLVVDTDDEPYAKLIYRRELRDIPHESMDSSNVEGDVALKQSPPEELKIDSKSQEGLPDSSIPTSKSGNGSNNSYKFHNDRTTHDRDHGRRLAKGTSRQAGDQVDQTHIPVPKASRRARGSAPPPLEMPSDLYMLRRYLESESPISRSGIPKNFPLPSYMESPAISMSTAPSKASMDASKGYWSPPTQLTTSLTEAFGGFDYGEDSHDALPYEKRHSWRSDVSVWNNWPGRVPEISVPLTAPPQMYHVEVQERGNFSERGYETKPRSLESEEEPHSRNESNGRGNHQSDARDMQSSTQPSRNELYHTRSHNQPEELARSYSSSAVLPADFLGSQTVPKGGAEEISRGRRGLSKSQLGDRRHRSHSNQMSHKEPADLSRFVLIEEYSSHDCPIHGSRPSSETRRRPQSRTRGRLENPSQPGQPTNSSGRQSSRQKRFGDGSQQAGIRSMSTEALSHSKMVSREDVDTSRHRRGTEMRMETRASSTGPDLYLEPKTPTAMSLVRRDDMIKETTKSAISSLKSIEKSVEGVVRRRVSSQW